MTEKFLIAIVGEEKAGKTCTINHVWDLLPCYSSADKVDLAPDRPHEIWGYVNPDTKSFIIARDAKIGVTSRGDTSEEIIEWLVPLMSTHECDIIVCACHHYDNTLATVKKLAHDNGYTLITCSNFCNYNADRTALKHKRSHGISPAVSVRGIDLSQVSAQAIVGLIERLIH